MPGLGGAEDLDIWCGRCWRGRGSSGGADGSSARRGCRSELLQRLAQRDRGVCGQQRAKSGTFRRHFSVRRKLLHRELCKRTDEPLGVRIHPPVRESRVAPHRRERESVQAKKDVVLECEVAPLADRPFHRTPCQLNEVELAMELGVEKAPVPACDDDLLQAAARLREVRLQGENAFRAASGAGGVRRADEPACALLRALGAVRAQLCACPMAKRKQNEKMFRGVATSSSASEPIATITRTDAPQAAFFQDHAHAFRRSAQFLHGRNEEEAK